MAKEKFEVALDILFADNIEELEDHELAADVLGVRLFMTDHWYTLRMAAKSVLLDEIRNLKREK